MKDLNRKTVIVTGAANGIGACLAGRFLEQGARLIACDIDAGKLENDLGSRENCSLQVLDVREPAQWEKVFHEAGPEVDYLVNAAGIIRPGYLSEMSVDDIHLQIDVNLKGVIFGTQAAAAHMRQQGRGHIINLSSMASIAPVSGIGIYTASKFGVRGFSLAMAQELAGDGIKVSVVAPDAVDTGMLDDQMHSEAAALTFSGDRLLTVDDVADAVFRDVIAKEKTEVWIPMSRGIQAYLGATFPQLAGMLTRMLRKKGLRQQAEFRERRSGSGR